MIKEAEALTPELEAARHETRLPTRPDLARANALLVRVREETARRFITRAPGPWGASAPTPPPVEWEEDP